MKNHLLHKLSQVLVTALFVMANVASAQTWPLKPLRLIVPFPPGGGSDGVGRIIAQKLTERLGQQVVVENRGGAGGSMGTEAAVRSAPDGYTMVLASTSEIAINPSLYARLSYDTVKDLIPVAMVATTPMVVIVNTAVQAKSMADLVAIARAKPGELNVASAGAGTISHLSGELFRSVNSLNWTHIPYKGTGPALTDLVGGQVQVMFVPPGPALPLVKSNRARLIAVSGRSRAPTLPDTPTVAESGGPDYSVDNWYAIFMPIGTPPEIVARLADEVAQSLKSPDLISSLTVQGAAPAVMNQTQFTDYVKAEVEKWGRVVKATGVKAD
jgi:tripartite-type tricarboxylate transporter receptor subunit TctC